MAGRHLNRKLESESVSPPILDLEGGGEGELETEEGQSVRLKVVGKPPLTKGIRGTHAHSPPIQRLVSSLH